MDTIHAYRNEESMMEARVCKHNLGFSVVIVDLDSGEFCRSIKIFHTEDAAREYAKKI
jgi:hypothetical protein